VRSNVTKLLYVVRHCQGEGQAPEARLTREGHAQAGALAAFLTNAASADAAPIHRIISSSFVRARQSIAPLAEYLGLPVEIDDRLCERTLTVVPRLDWLEQLRASFDDLDLCLEGGESSRTAMERANAVVEEVRRYPARTTVLVTHGNLMTLLLRTFDARFGFDEWRRLTNPDVFRVTLDEQRAQAVRIWRE
jgi:2,3-bisphosphoglycerate-dependent phosphoglycerate mutase